MKETKKFPRTLVGLVLAVAFLAWTVPPAQAQREPGVLFQTSTIGALMAGVYDGALTFRDLKKHGDLGLGTFNALDGEMIGLDGRFYQIKADGVAYRVGDAMKTPFAAVIFFQADQAVDLKSPKTYGELAKYLDTLIPTKNIFYALKITGRFRQVKTRSVARQNRPYPPLAEAVKRQAVFEFPEVRGTMVGFRSPAYAAGLNVPGYHLHFLTADQKAGGHVLDCEAENVKIEIGYAPNFFLALPRDAEFSQSDLGPGKQGEFEQVEK